MFKLKMNEQTKSVIRHILTAIGFILVFFGLDKYVPVIEYLQTSLDQVWEAVVILVGFIMTLFGFFTDKGARFKNRGTTESDGE